MTPFLQGSCGAPLIPSRPPETAAEAYALLRHYKEGCAAYVAQLDPDDPEHAAAAKRIVMAELAVRPSAHPGPLFFCLNQLAELISASPVGRL